MFQSISVLLLSLSSLASIAQAPKAEPQRAAAASTHPVPAAPAAGVEHFTLGQSIVPLYGPWRFSIGDSPIDPATNQPLWAEPGFDDSHWETVDLTPKSSSFDPITGIPDYTPGWTTRGHHGVSGYGWYRLPVRLAARPGERLAIAGPSDLDDGYQLFLDGTLIGAFGEFPASGKLPTTYNARPKMFAIPSAEAAKTTGMLAFRVYMDPATIQLGPDAGGLHTFPLLGGEGIVSAQYQLAWLKVVRIYGSSAELAVVCLLLSALVCCLVLFDRSDPVYLWLAAYLLLSALRAANLSLLAWSELENSLTSQLLQDLLFGPFLLAISLMTWWVWFRLDRALWVPRLILALALCYAVVTPFGDGSVAVPNALATVMHVASGTLRVLLLLLWIAIIRWGIRKQGREGWLAVPAVLLSAVAQFQVELILIHVRTNWFPFGVQLSLSTVALLAFAVTIFGLLIRRLMASIRVQRAQALDIKQAAEVQQVILPEALASYGNFTVQTEYRAARQVGGDFFQILPHPTDGSVLVVAGDVTGKGLQAGMLVALLVGAIRAAAEVNPDPLSVLESLNRRLIGRRSAQATCLALRIAADGSATLANAGHLPPYLNGSPLEMEGALPLGMIEGAEFSVMHFQLNPGDRLMIVSDGILEATNEKGELFGFDRIADLLAKGASTGELADAAEQFGQEDDISIVAVTRA